MTRQLVCLVVLLLLTEVTAQLTVSTPEPTVQVPLGQTTTLPCTYTLGPGSALREFKWYERSASGERNPVLFYFHDSGQEAALGGYAGTASLATTEAGFASLRLTNARFTDNGTFECLVGAVVAGIPQEATTNIDLMVLVAPSDPKITGSYDDNTGILNLTCTALHGYPAARLTWYRDGVQLPAGSSYIATDKQGFQDAQTSVSFRVTPNGAGAATYRCDATHEAFTRAVQTSGRLGPPIVTHITTWPTSIGSLMQYDDVILTCASASGLFLESSYRWSRDGGRLPDGAVADGNQLRIVFASTADSGTYTCTASNAFGHGSSSITLHFKGRPLIRKPETQTAGGLPGEITLGIVLSVFAVVAAVFAAVYWYMRRRKGPQTEEDSPSLEQPGENVA